jgi:outer membrane protein assembly factor BamB
MKSPWARAAGCLITITVAGWATGALRGASGEWPQWRGPDRTGIVPAKVAPSTWPERLNKGWSVAVGEGYSSPVGGAGRVFVHSRRDPDEVVVALDATTGKTLWEQKYAAPMTKNPYAKAMLKGPYSTPLFSDGRLYTLGTTAILSAWNASTGALLWRKDYSSGIDTSKLFCGTAMSPIQTKEGIVIHIGDDRGGSVIAFDPATGKERWTRTLNGPGYASPIEMQLQGTRQIVTMTTRSVVGVAPESGALLWEFPFDDEWNENIVTPIGTPTGVIVSGVRQGTRALTLTKSGAAWVVKQAWHTPDVAMYMSSPVLVNGTLFGHSAKRKGQFVAVNPADGKIVWSTEGRAGASASVVAAGKHLLFLTTESELVVARLDPSAYQEVRRYTLASTPTYAHPMLVGHDLIVRDTANVTRWSVN